MSTLTVCKYAYYVQKYPYMPIIRQSLCLRWQSLTSLRNSSPFIMVFTQAPPRKEVGEIKKKLKNKCRF